jgi:hypothetical protein
MPPQYGSKKGQKTGSGAAIGAPTVNPLPQNVDAAAASEQAHGFVPFKDLIIKGDKRGRLTVGEPVAEKQYRVLQNGDGQILLDPVVVMPEREAWLFRNPEALLSVVRGLGQSASGATHDLGSFAQFADDAADDE